MHLGRWPTADQPTFSKCTLADDELHKLKHVLIRCKGTRSNTNCYYANRTEPSICN